uniref:Exportin-1 C-terminal domain-containing protein n=1 Tax=Wuchereria bancrofti TaxID=6293 RepID=A0A1I8EEB6_WUCBA
MLQKQRSENEDGNEAAANEAQSSPVTAQKWAYISAIQYLLKGWSIVLQNAQFVKELTGRWFDDYKMTMSIISSFMHAIFSVPFGEREEVSVSLPDREIFKEILIKIGSFSSYFFGQSLSKIFTILAETVEEFLSTIETNVTVEELNMWRENMHWILLIVGHSLVEEDDNHNYVFQNRLLNYYENIVTRENNDFSIYALYIKACIVEPQDLTDPSDIDLVIKIIGIVFAWFSVEDILLKDHGIVAISTELCGTSLWCAKRLISALGIHIQNFQGTNQLAKVSQDIIQILIDFALQKSFRIIELMPDEKKICTDAVQLLSTLAYTTYRETSKSVHLYSYLTTVKIENLSVRSSLLKVLVQFGSIINDEGKQKTLYEMILMPIRNKFMVICEKPTATNKNIEDLLECFCAVAEATQKCSANFLFEYLKPVLNFCIDLLSLYTESISTVNAVLQFFNCFTKRLSMYCDNHDDMLLIYDMLLELIQMYETEQAEQYKTSISKEKASDLIVLLEILINALDKRSRPVNLLTGEPELIENRSHIIVTACNMFLSVMRYDFFKLPVLRKNFYRFLKCSTEMAPECIAKLSEENFILIVDYLRRGLQSESEKDNLLSSIKDCFEQEVSINSANAITNLGIYFTKHIRNDTAIKNFSILIEPTFTICLNAMWQEDAQSLATSAALYSLSCCDEDACKTYIKNLLSREVNHPHRTLLRTAFRRLMTDIPGKRLEKSEQRNFHDRLKHFLIETKGLLVIE